MKIKTQFILMLVSGLLVLAVFAGAFTARLLWWIALQGWNIAGHIIH